LRHAKRKEAMGNWRMMRGLFNRCWGIWIREKLIKRVKK
jgi:hypothetical protein